MTRLSITTALILAAFSFGATPAMAGDAAAGEKIFNKCKACHQVGEKAKNRVGPMLNGTVGQPAGAVEGFKYSDALSGSGLVWDEATLAAYLADPKATVPGNKMAFVGLRKDEEIADVIAFLASHASDGTLQ
ncbi:MAG: c-type cytochrome [Roseovarius sp.]